jgi:pimeloyl-ACP methyl ester carboxylesterase
MNMQTFSPQVDAEADRKLQEAQARYLAKRAPGTKQRRVRWSGGETQVLELGDGQPVVLVHGGLGDAFDWAPIMPALADRFHIYAVDRPGHGLADPFDYTDVDLLVHARTFLGEMLDALGLRATPIIANSMGGLWSVTYALQVPDRVSRLVLVGVPAGSKRGIPLQLRLIRWPLVGALIRSAMRKPTPERVRSFFKQILVAHSERLDEEFLEAAVWTQRRNLASWLGLLERAIDAGGIRRELVIGERWKELRVPLVFIWGEKDAFDSPNNGEHIASQIPSAARLVRIPDAGHLPWFDEPQRVTAEVVRALES